MSMTPLAFVDSLRIGSVDFVAPDEIKVLIDIDAPDSMAMNTGHPRPFPRINGYVLIPSDEGYLVGQVEWITIERSQYPKRKGLQDFGLIDLPYPLRKLSLNPLGCLQYKEIKDEEYRYEFRRGVSSYPTVGDPVLLPTQRQLRDIVESGENRRVSIGTSPLAAHAEVKIDPDRLFGRHLAVLGNTGSGKSCSVAGLIRWSLEEARKKCEKDPNARFIILDPNGEYSNTFKDMGKVRLFSVEPDSTAGVEQLRVPLWFWNSEEWCAFTQASSKTQRPTLIQALRTVREGLTDIQPNPSHEMRRYLRAMVIALEIERKSGSPWAKFPLPKNFFGKIKKWLEGLEGTEKRKVFNIAENNVLKNVIENITSLVAARSAAHPTYDFSISEIERLLDLLRTAHSTFGGRDTDFLPIDADIPRPFTGDQLLRSVEANDSMV